MDRMSGALFLTLAYLCIHAFLPASAVSTHRLAFHPLGGQGAGGDCGSTAEGLKSRVGDLAVLVHLDLKQRGCFQRNGDIGSKVLCVRSGVWRLWTATAHLELHDVTTRRCTHQSSAHVPVVFVQGAHIPGVLIVVHHLDGRQTHRYNVQLKHQTPILFGKIRSQLMSNSLSAKHHEPWAS